MGNRVVSTGFNLSGILIVMVDKIVEMQSSGSSALISVTNPVTIEDVLAAPFDVNDDPTWQILSPTERVPRDCAEWAPSGDAPLAVSADHTEQRERLLVGYGEDP